MILLRGEKMSARLINLFCVLLVTIGCNSVAAFPPKDSDGKPVNTLAPMLKQVNPAVVNISTYSKQQDVNNPLLNDPFFRRFFNLPNEQPRQQQKRQRSAGSGVIVNAKDGIVMTNYHVIKNADEVRVSLLDGRSFEAKIKGSDPDLDIAILEIKADDLAEVKIADSSVLEVGDFVVAIGNPFGLGQTVTTGIVSALGRSGLGIEGYENFIQTDASINPGNSGGALVNLDGELIGINTAIITPAGGNVGIGFAIPSNMASASMKQIIKHGEVKRGQIGIGIQDITPELREALGLANGIQGVLVSNVSKDTPAEDAGIESGDIILTIDGHETKSVGQLRSRIGMKSIGDKVMVELLREGKKKTLKVKVGKPASITGTNSRLHPLMEGVRLENNPEGNGVVISSIAPHSSAAYSGLRAGDIIIGANKRKVYDVDSLRSALQSNESSILLQVNRGGGVFYLVIRK